MNSPPDPASPSASTASSGSPPPEEASSYVPATGGSSSSYFSNLSSHITATFGGVPNSSSSKRRLPTGSAFGAASSARDSKTRRRGEPGRSGSTAWDGMKETGGKKEKDELLDQALVEHLRKGMCCDFFIYGNLMYGLFRDW